MIKWQGDGKCWNPLGLKEPTCEIILDLLAIGESDNEKLKAALS